MRLFGTSGIRGLANSEITADLAISLGKVLGSMHNRVVLGHDPRTSSKLLLNAMISGLLSIGSEVCTVGLVTTPTLGYAARNFECGIMITASHNPPEYNGIKLFNPDGSGFNEPQMQKIEGLLAQKEVCKAKWQDIRGINSYHNAVEDHIDKVLNYVNNMDMKIVVDCGCGAASTITPYLFQRLGCEVITLNCQPDGFFPGRASEPSPENLVSLEQAVVASGADLGIAHDGDADRMVAIDETGNYIGGDSLLALFAKHEVKNKIVVPVNASMAIEKVVGGAEVIRTKVGDIFISDAIKNTEADFGGEPSGTFVFPKSNLCPDGVFAAARLADLVKKEPLSQQISLLPKYPREKGTVPCSGENKQQVIRSINKQLKDLDHKGTSTKDGIRVQFEHAWALVRASGTEPKLRITVEAEDKDETKKLYDKIYDIVKGCAA